MTKEDFIQAALDYGFIRDNHSDYHRYNYNPDICVILSGFPDEPKIRFWGTEELRRRNDHFTSDDYADGWEKIQIMLVMDT